jgi:PmbA protein
LEVPLVSDLLDIAERVAGWAAGDEEVDAYVARGSDIDVDVYQGEVEAFSAADSEGVGIRVIARGRQGFAYAGSLDPEVVADAFAEARENAAFGTVDEHAGVARPDGVAPSAMSLCSDDLAAASADEKIALALELERRIKAGDPRIRAVPRASYGDARLEAAVATSTGIATTWSRTRCGISAYALAGEGDETQTGGGYSMGQAFADLDLDKAAGDAVERATRMLGATKPVSAKLPVVFEDTVAASVLSVVGSTLSGDAVLKGRSLFANRVGEVVAASLLTLVDDPTDTRSWGAGPSDAEGLASRCNRLIADGELLGFLYDAHSGRRAGVASTGSAVRAGFKGGPGVGCRALAVAPGTTSTDDIFKMVGNGLFVQSVTGLHSGVNPVSGDFSVGAEGRMIRDGKLAEPVREFTVASTIQRMLLELIAVGDTLEWLPGAAAGVTLAIGEMSISGA